MKFYKKFTFKVAVRILLILGVMIALALIFGDERLFFNQIILTIVMILQIVELLRFVNHTNRELTKFLLAIRHQDFSINFGKSKIGQSFEELNDAFTDIIKIYKDAKIENERQFHHLKMVVSNINIGILSVENEQNIVLINKPAEHLLNAEGVKNWKILLQKQPFFVKEIESIGNSGRKLINIEVNGETRTLSVDVNSMLMFDKNLKLITFQDIKGEIEQTEIEAWHKLIRILTHEIMNSATPISSLTETMQTMLERNGVQRPAGELNDEVIGDLLFSLKTIHRRSDGMLAFIEDYRQLTKISKPKIAPVAVNELFEAIQQLMSTEFEKANIRFTTDTDGVSTIPMDSHLIEQVLINLITNSIHALEGVTKPEVSLKAIKYAEKYVIKVSDNGCGISQKELNQIFVPFFSTKKQGSGIGLSLSKQIMHLHRGNIKASSELGGGTTFSLFFQMKDDK
ncbi:two-component system sensor histidine kinase [Fulvivirga imtechensis AK7]|uniref:histidine kinase n=1 Tax=Fulvivirga imtechensis AK7 TaxID=1237149 RepID=L8JIX5_9BACT|nr:ATP-binding protein [Fulvivirga imtechensis]ELR68198.1 two-component system sensor histidine kinase [Fulvivirga imtechensis AK7]